MLRNLLVTSSPLKLPILSNLPVVVVLYFIDLHTLVQSVTLCTVRLVFLTHFIINVVSEFSEFSYKFIITYGWLHYSFEVFLNSSWLLQFFWFFEPMQVQKSFWKTMVFCYQNCSDLLWEKCVLVIEKNFWNSRLKAENLQNFWDPHCYFRIF